MIRLGVSALGNVHFLLRSFIHWRNELVSMENRKRLLATTMIAGMAAVGFASPAFAQSAPQEEVSRVDEIVVTGSRIARRDAVAESPILTVQQEDITHSGATTVEHYLNTLPQITAGLSSQSNNPSSNGRAFIDLRGLGSGRNLVLIDGRRPMGSTAAGTVDTNTIPASLIERVEIISGGAASTYGADAVSGVVNFILRDSFEGIQLDSQYRLTEQGDGQEWSTDITFGGNFADGKGNAVFNAGYFNREAMYKDAREFSGQASSTTTIFPGGSAGMIGANRPTQGQTDAYFGGANRCANTGGHAGFGFNPDGTIFCSGLTASSVYNMYGYTGPESAIATHFAPNVFSYNFEPDNILVLPMERWNLFTRMNYEVNEQFKPYVQAMYTNYNALQELAPTPAGGATGWNVAYDNPFISPELAGLLALRPDPTAPFAFSKRFNDLGGRTGYNTHDVWQGTIGTRGRLARTDTWQYDVYASFGRSVLNEVQGGNVRRDRVGALLGHVDAKGDDETDAQYAARVLATRAPTIAQQAALSGGKCPNGLNLFGSAPIDQSCADYISLQAKNLTVIEQSIVEATVNGDLFELPAGPLQGAFGISYRQLDFDFKPDSGLQPGIVAGFNEQSPVSGFLNWTDLFGELLVPIVRDVAFAKDVSLSLGYRVSDNSRSGSTESWKANLEWAVNDWFRVRGGMQTATRSPSISELFSPQTNNFPSFDRQDPCDVRQPPEAVYGRNGPNAAKVAALCAAQSIVAGDPTFAWESQANTITGGNPDLMPETSESWTLGFVSQSPFNTGGWADSLYLSVDYWSISLEDVISAPGAGTVVQRCFNRDDANPTFDPNNEWCQLFQRNQATGGIEKLKLLARNQAFTETSGVDVAFNVRFDTESVGTFGVNVLSTWVEKFTSQLSTVDRVYDYVGTIGTGTGSATPEWRHTVSGSWSLDPFSLTATARYIDAMDHSNTLTGGAGTGTDSVWYFDLRGSWDVNDTVSLRAGVNNLLDEQPQLYSPNVQSNTDPSTYDVLGRRYFVGLTARF
ncbi:MAG TPA: TonB-dependent receptor [Brevundimonas sp.]|nr:TonB-dependent receptor [Brevundimonas sp.]